MLAKIPALELHQSFLIFKKILTAVAKKFN